MGAYTNIDDPSVHHQSLLYTGDDSSTTTADRNLVNTGNSDLQPDWLWLFNRDTSLTGGGKIFDSTRGTGSGNSLSSQITNGEGYNDALYGFVNAFNSDGFGVRAGSGTRWYVDRGGGGGDKYVAWQWKANGGTTSTNSDGNISSVVQANQDAGFSIVTWTGDGSASGKNVGHGLGAVPHMIISKDRGGSSNLPNWHIYHPVIGNTHHLTFTNAAKADSPTWGDTDPTSSVFSVGGEGAYIATNQSSTNYVAYCFAPKQGYSRFAFFRGNGSTNGPFVYTGFKPAFLMFKQHTNSGNDWFIFDSARSPFNGVMPYARANGANADGTGDLLQFMSNGFKLKHNDSAFNGDGHDYIYMAFAENPFVTSGGAPTTAR